MGCADVVPGVSGGTVALIVGIYGRLIEAIGSFDLALVDLLRRKRIRQAAEHIDLRFLAALGLGIGTAVVSLAKIITWLILNRPVATWSLFFGLILASTFLVYRMVEKWTVPEWFAAASGSLFAYWISGRLPTDAPHTYPVLFTSGMIAICAMILPGISGSFILVILGQYLFVLEAVHNRDIPVIIVFSAGCAIGLLAFTKLLRYLLKNHKTTTMASLCGLMIGSLRKIWPFKSEAAGQELLKPKHRIQINILPDAIDEQTIWAVAMVIAGIAVVFLAEYAAGRAEKKT